MSSRKEVAELAGVSEATVSRVLNGVGPMKEETRRKVLAAAEQLGYVPSAIARQFARRKSGNIGVILPFVPKVHLFSTYYFSEILSGIGEAAKRLGYDLLLIFRDEGLDYAQLFRMRKIDACIVLGSQSTEEERNSLAELAREKYPFCLVNQRFDEEGYLSVDADHKTGSYEAVRHLIENGCKQIAFINGPELYTNSLDRFEGYKKALAEAGLELSPELLFTGNYSSRSGYAAAAAIAERYKQGEVDAVFTANDRMGIGLMNGLRACGIETGKQIAIIGYDDSDGSRIVHPQLSTVAVPFYEMGQRAAELLLNESIVQPQSEVLPVRLVKRASSLF
ncbi:LacI family DNA-binding transcriptional regulator [Paenibacillus protaetiae]|uniref:LacI family transcriptional regulator n=1 Tax=Paenibacillus protaetiae TaxID=2509456 RepID=A0A4P6F8N0_9BACL|nr:LacI family DNA-binding transcriptional regulator [Paenibacillus protaetiae]QAY66808.1 LacI family transcriptional regulator [Paenibacillus protaetiae]